MKNVNLIEMLRGCSMRNGMAVSASNPDGQPTVNRQSRLMSHRGYLKNLAMIFAVLVMSVGQMWGATETYTLPTSGTLNNGVVKYEITNDEAVVVNNKKILWATRGSVSKDANYGLRPYQTGFVVSVSGPVKLTFNVKSNTTSARTITGQAYLMSDALYYVWKNTNAGSSLETYVTTVNAKSAGSRTDEEAVVAANSKLKTITSQSDNNKKLLTGETADATLETAHRRAINHACPTVKLTTNSFADTLSAAGNYLIYLTSSGGSVGLTTIDVDPLFPVRATLINATKTSGDTLSGLTDYNAVFAAADGYTLPSTITVTIGGNAATAGTDYTWDSSTGAFQVPKEKVTGAIVITITGEAAAAGSGWGIAGTMNSWTAATNEMTGSGTVSTTISLSANTQYEFKVVDISFDTWYGNGGTIKGGITDWLFETSKGNTYLRTSCAGDYTFTFNTSTKRLSITYPNSHKVYFDKDGASWSNIYAYCYNDGDWNIGWPGIEITSNTEDNCGTEYYAYTNGYTYIIFNNGSGGDGNQTGNITVAGYEGNHAVGAAATGWTAYPTYTVTYDGNEKTGGSVPTDGSSPYACSSTVTVLGNTGSLVRTGYNFTGWNTAPNGSGAGYTAGNTFTISANTTLYAQWEAAKYTVTYNVNGGGSVTPTSATQASSGASVTLPTPTWSGYTFEGWYSAGTKIGNGGASYTPTADITLYAHWTDNISGKVFSFIDNNYGDKFKAFDLSGWVTADANNKDKTHTNATTGVSYVIDDATWETKSMAVAALAKFKGGTTKMSVVIPTGKIATVKISYGAYGTNASDYSLTVNGTSQTNPSTKLANDMTNAQVIASMKEITLSSQTGTLTLGISNTSKSLYVGRVSAVITGYVVTYAAGTYGSGSLASGTKTHGSNFTLSSSDDSFTRDGYVYDGWSTNADGSTKDYNLGGSYTTDAAITLYPHWVADCVAPTTVNVTATVNEVSGYWFYPGDDVVLTAAPTGSPAGSPVTYQWKKNGADIDGATSSTYTIDDAAASDAGKYTCTISYGACSTTSAEFELKCMQFYLKDSEGADISNHVLTKVDATHATLSLSLTGGTTYKFRVTDGCNNWYGNSDATGMTSSNCTNWTMPHDADCKVTTSSKSATYTFNFDFSAGLLGSEMKVSVVYPAGDQAEGKVIYWDNNVLKWASAPWYRIGKGNHNNKTQMTLVPGTANLYKITTAEYNGFEYWHIANNEGEGTGNIFWTKDSDPATNEAITAAMGFEGSPVTADAVTFTPTSSHATGSSSDNNNCEFYEYGQQNGMKTDRVTISDYSNGTITVTYDDADGTNNKTFTSGYQDLAHTVVLKTITAVPATGYDAGAITINGGAYSANYVVTGATTIAASFTLKTYTISYNKGTNGTGSKASETKTHGVNFTLPGSTFTYGGHTQDGWSTSDGGALAYALSGSYTTNAAQEFFPHWKCNTPTITDNGDNTVSITVPDGTTVYYTTDESTPSSSNGTEYTDAFDIDEDVTVKAIAIQDDCTDSEVASVECKYSAPAVGECDTIARVKVTGASAGTAAGTKIGSATVSLEDTKNAYNDSTGYKLGSSKYVALTLTSGEYFQNGDSVIVYLTKLTDLSSKDNKLHIYAGTSTAGTEVVALSSPGLGWNRAVLSNVPNNTSSITIHRGSGTSEQNHYVYAFIVKRCAAACDGTPSAPTATSNGATTYNTQAVSWTDASNEKWDVIVSESSSTPDAGDTPTARDLTSTSYTFTGLTASTEYHWWVRSVCDASHKSAWVAGSSFTTTAAPTLYTVSFNSNGGSSVDAITQASEGASIEMPSAPTYAGHTFQGWVIGGTTKAAGASYTPEANVTAYATWKENCAGSAGNSVTIVPATGYSNQVEKGSTNVTFTSAPTLDYKYKDENNNTVNNSTDSRKLNNAYGCTIASNSAYRGSIKTTSAYDNVDSISFYFAAPSCSSAKVIVLYSTDNFDKDSTTLLSATAIATSNKQFRRKTLALPVAKKANELTFKFRFAPSSAGMTHYIDSLKIYRSSGYSCYYVTYNGNGAEAGSISDAEAYASGSNVTVLGNTGGSAFTKTGYRFNGWNTSATGKGTAYAAGATISSISADVTLYAQWVADACSAPSAPTISGTSVRTAGQTITLNAACASGADASTTYTWFKGVDWATASAASPVQEALTAGEGGRIFNKASCVAGDAGTYWCEASNGDGCEAHNATGFAVTVNAAVATHIYYYKDADHYSDDTYSNPEGNTAASGDNKSLSSPWMICNGCMTGVDSVVAHGATYDGKGNWMNAYIKLPTDGTATTKNIKFALTEGYTGTLTIKIGGYKDNPTVTLQPLTAGVLGSAITPTSGTVGGVATTEDSFNDIVWPLATAGGTYVLTVTEKTGYISQIDMTTETSEEFNVTYNGNGNTGGTVPTDATNYASGATVTAAANSGTLVKTNYTGAGWNTANNGTGTNYVPGSGQFKITANTMLYAHWTQLITLAPGTQGTGTNNAAVSWNGSVLRGFAAHTASGYALQGYYTEPSGGTKVLNADGSFAATDIDGFVTSGKWSNTGAAPTLYAQWEASNLLKWNLKVNVNETSITTLSKESAVPTVITVANMGNLTNNGSLTITGSAKSALTSKIATTASATGDDAGKYMSVQFIVAAGYQLVPSDIKVKVQPISHSQTTKLILKDNNSQSISYTSGSLSKGSTHTVTMTNSEEVAFTGTVTLKIYVYGTEESEGYRLGTPIEINGSVEATCAPPTFDGISYSATEYTVGASASAISVTGAENVTSYLWKQNDVNDRSGGTAASGTNNTASYTPPTSAADTMYYWCEMTNNCTTVKTAAVGIMVRNVTTDPTVTWSNVKLGATDDVTPNYGGGNYVLRATVEETDWTGTLAASMITAPAGIRIHDVTTDTDGSDKKYIEFKFDVTTAFDRASNATIDFNLALPEAGSYSALNSEKNVTYNDCSGGAAGQVAIKMGATASTSKSNPQNYWETAGAGRLMYNYGGNMGSSYNSEGYKTADSTFNYYAASTGQKWMFQTYIAGVNKVRVVFRAAGAIKSSKATITNFYYNTEYFASPGSNAVSFGDVNANKAGYSSGEDGYIEFTVPEMAANSYGAFVTADGNMKVYGVVLYTENAGGGGSVATSPAWSDSKADEFTVNKTQSDANFTYTISTTTNTLGAISYSSSNPSVAAVDPVTGEVTITATGASAQNATITATLARSGCYQGATRTYTINVAGYSCSEPSGSVELTSGSATKCASESVTLTMTGFTEGAAIQWYNGESTINNDGGYMITTTATQSTLTTTAAGTYSAIATSSCNAKRTNSITIANMDMSEQKTVRKVSQWYVKNGRLTPDIALWQLGEGETFKSVAWSPSNETGLDFVTRSGIVYLEGKEPSTNTSADIPYTLTLTITDACGTDHVLSGQTIKLTHQKNTDKHVLAFVVNGTAKGGFTEGITAAQTTSVGLYNAIAAQFDVQATNIYSTDDEQKLREYYSQYDILCITDYPNTQTKGVNSKSYVDAIGALIDIRPILTMEAFVSSLPNWKLKGVSGNPKSPSTRQYTMLLQCKDHEIFSGTKLTKVGEGQDALYRVTMVDKNQEEYKTLDANYGDGEHKANEGYQYGKKPALQGFTYTEEMSDNNMLPLGLIDDGAGNNLQVGIERQTEMEARMMVLGINSYAMERLDKDGQAIVINALKYLMKKSAEDISDCSVYFDGSDETDPTNWDNELNWGPSYASLPLPHQEVRILKECVVKDGVVARASGIKIIPRGRINHDTGDASGSLTIEPGGALIVDGKVRAAVAPNYFNATPTAPSNLVLQSNSSAQAALILDNSEGETQATVQMWNPSYWETVEGKKKKYWSYVAVPIQEADIPNFFWHGFTYLYDETSGWIKKGDGTSLYPFQGIGASLQTGNMETFYGPLATTESQDITLTFTADKGQGMNLIGNSWTAPIQIANFEEDDFGDAAAEVWVFNTGNKNDGHITMADGSAGTTTAGQWQTIPIGVAGLPGYTGLKVIPAMQAFEVNTESETTLHLDYDRLVRAGRENLNEPMRAPRRSAAKQIEATMRVRVSGELTHTDVYLLKDARFSDGFDNGWDGHYLSGDDRSAQLYAISEEEGKLAFLAQPEIEGTQLGFAPSKHGNEYTFSFSYDGDEEYYLNDIKLKTSTLISEEATYSFTYGDGDTNRFYISRTPIDAPQTSTGVDNTGSGEVKARKFIYRDKMYIMINGRVYSADGALVK